jgi:hypothetical protein
MEIYDFYGNFSQIYPISKDEIKSPSRDKWGYLWDMEDYMFENENGRGLLIQGILLETPADFNYFQNIFNLNFRKTSINSLVKEIGRIDTSETGFLDDPDLNDSFDSLTIKKFRLDLEKILQNKKSYFEGLKLSLRRGKIWISLNHYWTDLLEKETQDFWGKEIRVFRLPIEYSAMNRKDVWEESILEGEIIFSEDVAWEDLSYNFPNLVKYIDKEIRDRINVTYLGDCHDFGIL